MKHKSSEQHASNIAMIISAVAVCIGAIEIFLEILNPVSFSAPPIAADGDAWRELYHQPSEIPGLTYEITPNKGQHANERYNMEINSHGMRDTEPQYPDDAAICRIAAVGDSFTFGFGVDGKDTYPNILEQQLGNSSHGKHIDVLNFGVGGYSTHDEALVVRHKVQKWDPQLLIIGYYLNDPDINPPSPLFIYYKEEAWWQQWNLLRLIAKAWQDINIRWYGDGDYIRYLHATGRHNWQSVTAAFSDIGNLANNSGVPVLLVIFPDIREHSWDKYPYMDLHDQIIAAGHEENFRVIDLHDTYKHYSAESLMVRPGDPHPSKLGHTLAATEINNLIKTESLLKCQ